MHTVKGCFTSYKVARVVYEVVSAVAMIRSLGAKAVNTACYNLFSYWHGICTN